MDNMETGKHVLFLEYLSDNELSEGYLLKEMNHNDPLNHWSITTNKDIVGQIRNNDAEFDINGFIQGLDDTKNIKGKLIFDFSKNGIKKFHSISRFLQKPFIRNYTNNESEKYNYLINKNNRLLILVTAIKSFIKEPFFFFINVIILGIIRLIFGGILDYFINLNEIYRIKKEIKEKHKFSYLNDYLQRLSQVENTEDTALEDKLKELENKRFNIYNTIIAILIAFASLIVSIISIKNG
jgi:hypothetical protein